MIRNGQHNCLDEMGGGGGVLVGMEGQGHAVHAYD